MSGPHLPRGRKAGWAGRCRVCPCDCIRQGVPPSPGMLSHCLPKVPRRKPVQPGRDAARTGRRHGPQCPRKSAWQLPRLSGVGETRVALEKNVGSGPLLADRTASVPRRGAEKCASPRRPVPVALNSPRQGAKMVPYLGRCSGGPGQASKLRPAHAHACQAGFRSCRFVSGGWWWRSGVLPCPIAWEEEEEKQVLI